jgi:hypothetical protein
LQSHELWASNIYYLNDHREFEHGLSLFRSYIRIRHLQADETSKHFFEAMLEPIDTLFPQTPFYVASWSATDDDLAQWRAYSRGGTGYAIAMGGDVLRQLAKLQQFIFAPCVYSSKVHQKWVEEIVDTSFREMVEEEKKGIRYEHAGPAEKLIYRLLRFSPLMKHESFEREAEWRLIASFPVVAQNEDFALHEGQSTLVPHFPFKLKIEGEVPLAISMIRVGPCSEPKLVQRAAMLALQRYAPGNNGGRYAVGTSDVPYRSQPV